NAQIFRGVNAGEEPDDWLDRRDRLLLGLSELVDIDVVIHDNKMASVSSGGLSIVNGNHVTFLRAVPDPAKQGMVTIRWGDTDWVVQVQNGRLAGVLENRDE